MVEALDAGGGTQAFLRLAGPDGPLGPLIQYSSGRRVQSEPNQLRSGEVAYIWEPGCTDLDLGVAFQSLADGMFRAARSVTKPHVTDHDGKPVRRLRIGVHAREWYLEHPWPNRVLRDMSTFATYRLRDENLAQ